MVTAVSAQTPVTNANGAKVFHRAISLQECLEMGLRHNFQIKIERFNPKIALENLKSSDTIYDPFLSLMYGRDVSTTPRQATTFLPAGMELPSRTDYNDTISAGIKGKGPYGFTYSLPFTFGLTDSTRFVDSLGRPFSQYSGQFTLEMRQPLWKNAPIDAERRTLLVNRKMLKISELGLRQRIIDVITEIRRNYFELIFARENVKVQEKAVALAEQLLKENTIRLNAGVMTPLDVKQAESQLAMTKADLLAAQQALATQELMLKNLVVDDLAEWEKMILVPVETLVAVAEAFDVQESWRIGLVSRPDLAQLRLDIERRDIDLKYYKNQTKPDLSLVGRYGQRTITSGGEKAFTDLFLNRYENHYYGVELNFPIGNRAAKHQWMASREARQQAELMLQKSQQDIMVEIQNAIAVVRSSFERVEATRIARQAAELALSVAEQRARAGVADRAGVSPTIVVLQAQRDLTTASAQEIRALADYNKAINEVYRAEGTTLERLKLDLDFK